ncbi:hypothetical protein BJ878DRAFT_570441 [Calycina marina]|uniref:2EXR domain-containing protein n=1 Tax=Calycina marina TaxID=1763456 RepID=A0A9P7YWQ1_9HELO|nr:hypothetical protein BJ878DRAFT_570441 [Calycina marina]
MPRPHRPGHFDPPWIRFFPEPNLPIIATTFAKFLELPVELQLIVWRFAVPDPRVILVGGYLSMRQGDDPRNKASADIPGILHACKESRAAGLKLFRTVFDAQLKHPVFFRSGTDLLIFHDNIALTRFVAKYLLSNAGDDKEKAAENKAQMAAVKYIAIQDYSGHSETLSATFSFAWFPNLRHVLIERPGSTISYIGSRATGDQGIVIIQHFPTRIDSEEQSVFRQPLPAWLIDEETVRRRRNSFLRQVSSATHAVFDEDCYIQEGWKPPIVSLGTKAQWVNISARDGKLNWIVE